MAEFTIGAPIAYFTGLLALHSRCDNMYTQPCPCDELPCPSTIEQCVHFGMGVKPRNISSFLMAVALFVAGCISQYAITHEIVQQQLMVSGKVVHLSLSDRVDKQWQP